jgi:hypothetical protein
LGFHEEQIKDYVEKFCSHEIQKSSEIWNLIKESRELYITGKLPGPLQNDLNALKEIARNGMIGDQLIFEFELSDCGLFIKLEDKRQDIFCFLHLTIQEFLAALHV